MSTRVPLLVHGALAAVSAVIAAYGAVPFVAVLLGWSADSAFWSAIWILVGSASAVLNIGILRAHRRHGSPTLGDVFRSIGGTMLEYAYFAAFCGAFASLLCGIVIAGSGEGAGVAWLIASGVLGAIAVPLRFALGRAWADPKKEGETFVPSQEQEGA